MSQAETPLRHSGPHPAAVYRKGEKLPLLCGSSRHGPKEPPPRHAFSNSSILQRHPNAACYRAPPNPLSAKARLCCRCAPGITAHVLGKIYRGTHSPRGLWEKWTGYFSLSHCWQLCPLARFVGILLALATSVSYDHN